MNRKNVLARMSIVFMILSLFGTGSLLVGDVTLAVPERIQEYSLWCWAGTSQAVLNYYNQPPSQCEIANFAWRTDRCCIAFYGFNNSAKGCNKINYLWGSAGSVQNILANWGVSSSGIEASLSWAASVSELDNGFPFFMRFGWLQGGGGHFLVTYGYITAGSYLHYMDPWPGEGYTTSLYSWVVSAPDHIWTHTLTTYQ